MRGVFGFDIGTFDSGMFALILTNFAKTGCSPGIIHDHCIEIKTGQRKWFGFGIARGGGSRRGFAQLIRVDTRLENDWVFEVICCQERLACLTVCIQVRWVTAGRTLGISRRGGTWRPAITRSIGLHIADAWSTHSKCNSKHTTRHEIVLGRCLVGMSLFAWCSNHCDIRWLHRSARSGSKQCAIGSHLRHSTFQDKRSYSIKKETRQ